jgi:hypothetical protein
MAPDLFLLQSYLPLYDLKVVDEKATFRLSASKE